MRTKKNVSEFRLKLPKAIFIEHNAGCENCKEGLSDAIVRSRVEDFRVQCPEMTTTTPNFACGTAASRFVPANGLRLHLLEWGEPGRPALCFLHGGSAHAHWFDLVVPAFADRFHVIALDQRGHGESEWPHPPAYATEDFVADLIGVMDALGWRQMTVVGHSMGGLNSLALSAWRPDRVQALVIADSRPAFSKEGLGMMHERGQRGLRRHPSKEAAVAAFRLRPRDTLADPAVLRHIGESGVVERDGGWVYRFDTNASVFRRPADGWSLIGKIVAPTLILRAQRSPSLPPETAERLQAGIANATLVEIPDSFHHLTLDRPREVTVALDRFLSGL
jgi:pimeloyl-ACP methyl ester carboxylesterase